MIVIIIIIIIIIIITVIIKTKKNRQQQNYVLVVMRPSMRDTMEPLYHNRPLREQFPPLKMPTMLWIKAHQP